MPNSIDALTGPFDVILIVDALRDIDDCQATLRAVKSPMHPRNAPGRCLLFPSLAPTSEFAELLGLRMSQPPQNVLSQSDIRLIEELAGFDTVKSEVRILLPFRLFGLGRLINRFLSPLPLLRTLSLRHYSVSRSLALAPQDLKSVTVVVPARNERGNIEAAVRRIPKLCKNLEIIFIEGHSSDGTLEEMHRVKAAFPDHDIKIMVQPGMGKADAVFSAFEVAKGEVLIILDSDLTMPPEQLPKFWHALKSGQDQFVNGSRLVYPMDDAAMRFLNLVANKIFSYLFSWLLNQRYTDTLCGTKVLRRSDYARLKEGREYFGDFDPFGDFDLIFGASKLNLKTVEIPVRYASRVYGETQISRFRHGVMLLKMVVFAFFRIKAL